MKSLVFLAIALLSMGCERTSAPQQPDAASVVVEATATQTTAQVPPASEDDRKWSIEVDGQPPLAGDSIERRPSKDGRQSVSFFGQPAAIRLDIGPDNEVLRFNLQLTTSDQSCFFDAAGQAATWSLTMEDDHGEFSGEAMCGPSGASASEQAATKVKGWFDAELVRTRRPPKSRVTGAFGKEIPSLPPDNKPEAE